MFMSFVNEQQNETNKVIYYLVFIFKKRVFILRITGIFCNKTFCCLCRRKMITKWYVKVLRSQFRQYFNQ